MADLALEEYARRLRILDMMLSAHSVLRDRYERRAKGLTLLIMGLSVAAAAVAFISGEPEATIGPFTARAQVWVGMLTCLIFFLAILELLVEWRRKAWAHDEAAQRLSDLKAVFKRAREEDGVMRSDADLLDAYDHTMEALNALRVRIPDARFNALKAKHLRKVELSKRASARPERRVVLHRLDLFREGLKKDKKKKDDGKS